MLVNYIGELSGKVILVASINELSWKKHMALSWNTLLGTVLGLTFGKLSWTTLLGKCIRLASWEIPWELSRPAILGSQLESSLNSPSIACNIAFLPED